MFHDMIARNKIETLVRERKRIPVRIVSDEFQFVGNLVEDNAGAQDQIEPGKPGRTNVPIRFKEADEIAKKETLADSDIDQTHRLPAPLLNPILEPATGIKAGIIIRSTRVALLGAVQFLIKLGRGPHSWALCACAV